MRLPSIALFLRWHSPGSRGSSRRSEQSLCLDRVPRRLGSSIVLCRTKCRRRCAGNFFRYTRVKRGSACWRLLESHGSPAYRTRITTRFVKWTGLPQLWSGNTKDTFRHLTIMFPCARIGLVYQTDNAASRNLRIVGLLALMMLLLRTPASAQEIVRYQEGITHGFLILRDEQGNAIAEGDLMQTAHGDRVSSRLVFHFKDGSLDDETTTFSQRGKFRLLTDRHIQKGPSFKQPVDVHIDGPTGHVVIQPQKRTASRRQSRPA